VTLPDYDYPVQGRIQDLKLGGGALKKIAPSGGRRDINGHKQQGYIQGAHPALAPPPQNWKKYDFLAKIVIYHTKYPKDFRASLRSAQFV
jgi:hypothetical protein